MKLHVLSDLHLEFVPEPLRRGFLQQLWVEAADAVALAGDVASHACLAPTLRWFCEHYGQVLFVSGNHEHYHSSFAAVRSSLEQLCAIHSNLHVLDHHALELDGQRFLGTPLWFPDQPENERYSVMLNDFQLIEDFAPQVYLEAARAAQFLQRELRADDVVLTHHLPSEQSVHQQYKGSLLTRFFVHPLDELVLQRQPALWIHGHTHLCCDYLLGQTRVLCNPYGYYHHEENLGFQRGLVVEL